MNKYTLPDLPYAYDALEPYIDAKTMEFHHDKHHAAYINKLNTALEKYPALFEVPLERLLLHLPSLPDDIRTDVRNHGGGHFNHSLFWKIMSKESSKTPVGILSGGLEKTFGSFNAFKAQFEAAAAQRFGSGWAWLSLNVFGALIIHSMPNQDSPLMESMIPILGLDVWEHAYYLSYQNRRPDYITAFWNVVDWKQADVNYHNALNTIRNGFPHTALKIAS